ncbi:MAG: hypothetical protein ACRETT_09330 [Steroidobacteraceae bacterium]
MKINEVLDAPAHRGAQLGRQHVGRLHEHELVILGLDDHRQRRAIEIVRADERRERLTGVARRR